MTTKTKGKGVLPKVELLIIAVFFISFLAWVIPKCSSRVVPDEEPTTETESPDLDTVAVTTTVTTVDTTQANINVPTPARTVTKEVNSLWITINNLKVRKTPDLKSDVITQLPLFEKVYYMEEVTDSLYEINLGYETATEPYVKIRTKRGIEGWVYGAGVNYIKKKRSGVME